MIGFWPHAGTLRVAGMVTDSDLSNRLISGEVRGLSLGTNVMMRPDGSVGARVLKECSLVKEPAREGCWVDVISNKRVMAAHAASSGAGTLPPAAPQLHHQPCPHASCGARWSTVALNKGK